MVSMLIPKFFFFKYSGLGGRPMLFSLFKPFLNIIKPKIIPNPANPKPYFQPYVSPKYAHSKVAAKAPKFIPI